jgi:hypothetical protein
MCGRTELAL